MIRLTVDEHVFLYRDVANKGNMHKQLYLLSGEIYDHKIDARGVEEYFMEVDMLGKKRANDATVELKHAGHDYKHEHAVQLYKKDFTPIQSSGEMGVEKRIETLKTPIFNYFGGGIAGTESHKIVDYIDGSSVLTHSVQLGKDMASYDFCKKVFSSTAELKESDIVETQKLHTLKKGVANFYEYTRYENDKEVLLHSKKDSDNITEIVNDGVYITQSTLSKLSPAKAWLVKKLQSKGYRKIDKAIYDIKRVGLFNINGIPFNGKQMPINPILQPQSMMPFYTAESVTYSPHMLKALVQINERNNLDVFTLNPALVREKEDEMSK